MVIKGQKINDRYQIIKTIGEGGMANVYLAEDIILNRKVAVKILRGDLSSDDKFVRRFQREALSASSLSHPNIVEMYDVGEDDGNYYIVMEYIEGKTLKELIKKRGALALTEVIDIMLQLTSAVAHAHESYIIHRDIKPLNILIMEDGRVKITDFGIAMALNGTQLTQTNSVMGSVHYLPPEQANGNGATIKSDIYSLGILMYELLLGRIPFKGDNAVEIALKHLKDEVPSVRKQNDNIPQSVENVIIKATAKNPQNRYSDAMEMYNDLKTVLDESRKEEDKYLYEHEEQDLETTKRLSVINSSRFKDVKVEESSIAKPIEEKKINKTLIILSGIIGSLVLLFLIIFLLVPALTKVPEFKIPDVSGMTVVEAEKKLKEEGFEVATKTEKISSDTVDEGLIVKTEPGIGRTRRKGTVITLYESTGTTKITLEDYTGRNYIEVKAILEELYELNVLIEKEESEDDEEVVENSIIRQEPEAGTEVTKGDTVTLYIPDIVSEYPDMVKDAWSVSDVEAFAEEYGLILTKEYVETIAEEPGTIIYQSRTAGTKIISGTTLKIKITKEPIIPDDETEEETPTE
ncbi:MAG: Stk1 family PASTA domain-containing Ser/Thr kinase [Bacilli bacterium]